MFKLFEEKGKIILIVLIILSLSSILIFYLLKFKKNSFKVIKKDEVVESSEKKEEVKEVLKEEIKEESKPIKNTWLVDVKGEVNKPGVHEVSDNMRINDVIIVAGGLTKNADTSLTNLSKKVTDEMVIIIYSKEEVKELNRERLSEKCGNGEIILNGKCTTEVEDITIKKVNINKASLEELITIPNIGEVKAKSIIDYRKDNPFTTIEDIKNVPGIGDSTYELIKSYIEV